MTDQAMVALPTLLFKVIRLPVRLLYTHCNIVMFEGYELVFLSMIGLSLKDWHYIGFGSTKFRIYAGEPPTGPLLS